MPQIPINPFDNDRLKTRKVRDNLAELGALPSDPSLHPSFLRSRRSAVVLIDRALNALAPDPMLVRASASSRAFASTLNAKFAAAFLVPPVGGGAGSLADIALTYLDFTTAEYFVSGSAVALSDVMALGSATVVAGTGLVCGGSPQATGALLAALSGEQTVIVDIIANGVDHQYIQWTSTANDAQLYRWGGQANLYTGDNDLYVGSWVADEPTRIAFLIGATECAVACNGSAAEVGVGSTLDFNDVTILPNCTIQRFLAVAPVTSDQIQALSIP